MTIASANGESIPHFVEHRAAAAANHSQVVESPIPQALGIPQRFTPIEMALSNNCQ